jgi:hypothetical protein
MQLTDYSIEDLKVILIAINETKKRVISSGLSAPSHYNALLHFEVDIEQAIKDIQFEQERKDNLPREP